MNIRQTLLEALRRYRGDDLERARWAFANYTEAQLDSEYGVSGQTAREILAGYTEHARNCDLARAYVESLPETL